MFFSTESSQISRRSQMPQAHRGLAAGDKARTQNTNFTEMQLPHKFSLVFSATKQ